MAVIPASALSCDPSDRIDAVRLDEALRVAPLPVDVIAVRECASTNALLAGRPGGIGAVLCVADRQTAGRGRRGRTWMSTPEASLTFSLAWHFPAGCELSGLSLAVGLALRDTLAGQGFAKVGVKWPNDLVMQTPSGFGKLGGVLIELSGHRDGTRAIVGVGINLNAPPATVLAAGATMPMQAAGLNTDGIVPERTSLLAALAAALCWMLDGFAREGFAPLQAAWNAAHAFDGRQVVLHGEDGHATSGLCLGVDADGALRVRTAAGEMRWVAGDVSLRGAERDT